MSILESLITNRTAEDVARWRTLRDKGFDAMTEEEKAEWMAGMRGAYNAPDLNRITEAMEYIAWLYKQYGKIVSYTPVNITHADGSTDTTWRFDDIPTNDQLSMILQNILTFWSVVESAAGDVVEVWSDMQFGYVDIDDRVNAGDYARMTDAHGIKSLVATIQGGYLQYIGAAGTGWVFDRLESAIIAKYEAQNGAFADLQDALDSLVLFFTGKGTIEYADASVSIKAVMRSGAEIQIGTGSIHWSSIINWSALEAYAYTWQDIEQLELTWGDIEQLPPPITGGQA